MIKWNQFSLGNEIASKCKQYKLVKTIAGYDFYINGKLITTFKVKKVSTAQKKAEEYINKTEKDNTKYITEACKIYELYTVLENIASDDNKQIEDYSQEEILHQAKYVLSCFNEAGHSFNESLNSEDKETKQEAKKQMKKLEKYIEKYYKAV